MTTTGSSVAIVIPVHNGAEHITAQLDAVASSTAAVPSVTIVVVDNLSSDGTAHVVTQWSRARGVDVQLESAAERPGEPYARNVGWQATDSDLILFCDADDVVSDSWAPALVAALGAAEYATGPLDTRAINPPEVAEVRGQSLFGAVATLHGVVPFAHGANMGFRRSTLERLGGFDESFLIGCDIELAIRAWRRGFTLVWVPDAIVHYRLRSTPSGVYRQARAYGRSRRSIDAQVPELLEHGARSLAPHARRVGWLVRHLPSVGSRPKRLRWIWVAGQVLGEAETMRGSRHR